MSASAFAFWICALSASHLFLASTLAQALGLVWIFILGLIVALFCADLDLLAATLFAVYTSVFLFLTLFSVFLSSYWAASSHKARAAAAPLAVAGVASLALWSAGFPSSTGGAPFWTSGYSLAADTLFNPAYALHLLFYRAFVLETLLINLYLFLGLVLATAALSLYRKGAAPAANPASVGRLRSWATKVRAVRMFRRQTRRKNNTTARQRALLCFKSRPLFRSPTIRVQAECSCSTCIADHAAVLLSWATTQRLP